MKKKNLVKMLIMMLATLSMLASRVQSVMAQSPEQEFTPESIERMEAELAPGSEFEGQYLTYTVDNDGNIVRVDGTRDQSRSAALTIAAWVGTTLVGYLACNVIDGIVIAATGQSGGWWVAQAIQNVLNRPYTGKTYLNCNVYPMHSYEGAMCRQYV